MTEGDNPPEECPNCHYSVTFWVERIEERQLTLKDFVRTKLLRLDARSSALDAAKLMRENDAGSVLITVDDEHVGIITERDILNRVAAEDLRASSVRVGDVMSTTIFSASSDTSIRDALKLMAKHHIRRLLVTEGGKPIGMVSQRSIIGGSFRQAKDRNKG